MDDSAPGTPPGPTTGTPPGGPAGGAPAGPTTGTPPGGDATGAPAGPAPPARRGPRAWETALVAGLALLLYLHALGSTTLWDPWETHYAEVARRMLEERDLLFMRWQTETFYSKPPLTFWLMTGGLRLVGVGEDGGRAGRLRRVRGGARARDRQAYHPGRPLAVADDRLGQHCCRGRAVARYIGGL